jgi:hypothetical protein
MEWTLDKDHQPVTGTSAASVDQHVTDLIEQVNSIWVAGANIAFFSVPPQSNDGRIPIIEDPLTAPGESGDLEQEEGTPSLSYEVGLAVDECNQAWTKDLGANPPGIPIVLARGFVNPAGTYDTVMVGAEDPLSGVYMRAAQEGRDLCSRSRTVLAEDVAGRSVVVQTRPKDVHGQLVWNDIPVLALVVAHELGHSLLLQHGDGRDNDGNGRFDYGCDTPEFNQFDLVAPYDQRTIMDPYTNPDWTRITPLQAQLARAAAAVTPGTIGGPP